jgi:predicted RNA binding protein YcfA (HicA-like mRNA interferase family)
VSLLSQWNKLIDDILNLNRNIRFDDLVKALIRIGYAQSQPKRGGSHYTFRKSGKDSITIPKSTQPMNRVYIELVRTAIIEFEREADNI